MLQAKMLVASALAAMQAAYGTVPEVQRTPASKLTSLAEQKRRKDAAEAKRRRRMKRNLRNATSADQFVKGASK